MSVISSRAIREGIEGDEVLSPRSCGMVAGRVVRGGFSHIILPCRFEHPGTGVYLPSLVYICYIVGVRAHTLGR